MEPLKIGLCGVGTVGGGVLELLRRNGDEIARRAGRPLELRVLGMRRPRPGIDTGALPVETDVMAVAERDDVDVVVELIGGTDQARALVDAAIASGKHVVTANKALIAEQGSALFAAAEAAGVTIAFEAAVAGGIPIIKAVREGLAANRIDDLAGIINGTSNYILTEMERGGRDFADVLAEAQALGYAEADPTFDVEGIDAAHKLAILSALAFGTPLRFDAVFTEGISGVTRDDISYAEALGYRIKHLGITRRTDAGVELRVHPTLIPRDALLAAVDGVMNAVLVRADAVGPTLYYGAGAGAEATASAVVADLVDLARRLGAPADTAVPHLAFQADALEATPALPVEEVTTACYLRILARDEPGVLAQVAAILSEAGISIEALIQKEQAIREIDGVAWVPIVILTHRVREAVMNQAIGAIEALGATRDAVVRMRVESFA